RLTVRGADLQVQYPFPRTRYGQFVTSLAGTYINKYEILVAPGTEPLNLVNHANTAGYPPRFKGKAALKRSGLGGWEASPPVPYRNSYLDYDGIHELPSQTLLDLQLGYRFGDESSVRLLRGFQSMLGVINLTNRQGDFARGSFVGYDPLQADMRGRFLYLNL